MAKQIISLTLLIQKEIEAVDDDDYESQRDRIIGSLDEDGWCVSIEDEADL